MDRAMWQRHLAVAERHVAEAQRHVASQRQIVAELDKAGMQLEATLKLYIEDRDRLQADLSQ